MTGRRVAVAALFHETNVFASQPTEMSDFIHRWYIGEEIVNNQKGTRTVIGGFYDGAEKNNLDLVPTCAFFATPSGIVTLDAFNAMLHALRQSLQNIGAVEGMLLELHGSLIVEGVNDAEEAIIDVIRETLTSVPISIVIDFHTNMSKPRFSRANLVVGYRENPHVDTYDRGYEAASLLAQLIEGRLEPYRAHRGHPVIAAPIAQITAEKPFSTINLLADELREMPEIVNISVHGGYAYSDREYTGLGFSVTTDSSNSDVAELVADRLMDQAKESWSQLRVSFQGARESVANAVQGPAPVALADTGDNINGGSSGDTTWLLHEAVKYPSLRFLTTVADPAALGKIIAAGIGAQIDIELGGYASPRSGAPFSGRARVLGISDGAFRNTGPMALGALVSMGAAAWVRIENCDILVQLRAVQPNDPNLFIHIGIVPGHYDVLLLKGAAAVRAGWTSLVNRFVDAGTEGDTDSVLSRLPYDNLNLLP